MALPPSKLTEVIEGLADDFTMKARAIPGMLKKAGVKDEELKFANLGLPNPTENAAMEAWTKDKLVQANAKRTDKQDVIVRKGTNSTDYGAINVRNPTNDYEERIYTFGLPAKEGGEDLFRSEHFPDAGQNYLAHTRIQPMDLNGKKVRTILEMQSDLHANNREIASFNAVEDIPGGKEEIVNAPYAESLNRKLIERELFNAVEEGAQHSAIPISGTGLKNLHRSAAIQSVYENQIKNTAIKIAKQQGLNYSIEKKGVNPDTTINELNNLIANVRKENFSSLSTYELLNFAGRHELDDIYQLVASIEKGANEPEELLNTNNLSYILSEAKASIRANSKQDEYLVIDHPKGTKLNVNLYADSTAVATAAYSAYELGYSEEEVGNYLVEKQGYSPEEAKDFAKKAKTALDAGYSKEAVASFMKSKEVTTPQQDEVNKAPANPEYLAKPITPEQAASMTHKMPVMDSNYYDRVYRATTTQAKDAKELIASQEVLRPAMVSTMQQTKSFIGYDNQVNELVGQKTKEQRRQIIDFAAQKGMQVEYDPNTVGWRVMTEQGWQEVNPGIWQSIWKAKGELAGYVAGAVTGSKAGRIAGVALFPEAAPLAGTAGYVLGGLVGGAGGAVIGNDFDYIYEAMTHNAEMDAAVQQRRQINAAQASVLYDIIGGLAMKTPSAVLSLTKTVKGATETVRNKLNGEASVDNALSDLMFLNRDEADDIVKVMERFSDMPSAKASDNRLAAAIYTTPGGEDIARAAASISPIASRAIAKTIDRRAQDLLQASEALTDSNVAKLVQQDLKNYEDDVKNFYTTVKLKAAEAPNAANYKFDIDKLAIDPILESLKKNIDDPRTMEKFLLQVNRIQQFSKSRDFNDLLELRKAVNGFKYDTKITSSKDYERLNGVIANIDAAVTEGAGKVLTKPDEWLGEFKQANLQYAQMMNVKKNVLYKTLKRPGQDTDDVVRSLTRYITAEDSTFMDVVAKLPPSTKAKVEGSVINSLTEKYTAGSTGGQRAVYFPQLSKALDDITFTTPEARKFKGAVQELAEVFRNDVPLASVSGSLRPPTDTSILTSDLLAATKRSFAAKIFNQAKRVVSSDSSKLIYKAAQVLENPLNTKSMKELMEQLDGKINLDQEAKDLLSAAAKEQAEKGTIGAPKVILYGDGSVLSTKGTGTKQTIAMHRIASIEQATKIAEAQGINPADTKLLDAALSSLGYKAVQQGADKVRVLK